MWIWVNIVELTGSDLLLLRIKAGLNKSQLAKKMNVDRKTIGNWEDDVGKPSFNQVVRLCLICNVSALLFFAKLAARGNRNTPIDLSDTGLEQDWRTLFCPFCGSSAVVYQGANGFYDRVFGFLCLYL